MTCNNSERCTKCGKNETVTVIDDNCCLCYDCLDQEYFFCEECKTYVSNESLRSCLLPDGRCVCESCYEMISAGFAEAKLAELLNEISERGKCEIYEAPGIFFIVLSGEIVEIPNDASYSPKGGWFPDIIKGLSKDERTQLKLMMQCCDFDETFFDGYLSECFDYDEESATEYFEERSEKELSVFKSILQSLEENTSFTSFNEIISAMKRYDLDENELYYEWEGEWIPFYENIADTGEPRGSYEDMSDEEWLAILRNLAQYRVIR